MATVRMLAALTMACILAASAAAQTPPAGDWPCFMGPNHNCSSDEKGLLREWPAGGPKELWRAKVGRGWSCPSILGDDLVVTASELASDLGGENTEITVCLDAATGKEKWRHAYKASYAYSNWGIWCVFGTRATPAVTAKHVFSIDLVGNMLCLDRKTGRPVWSKDLAATYKSDPAEGIKGYPLSPVVVGKVVVVNLPSSYSGEKDPPHRVVGLDVDTGKQAWLFAMEKRPQTQLTQGHTPTPAKFGADECVVLEAQRALVAIRCSDGKEVWRSEHVRPGAAGSALPSPIVVGHIIFHSNIWEAAYAVEVDRAKPPFAAKVLWKQDLGLSVSQCGNPAYWDGYLYDFIYGEDPGLAGERCTLMCVDLRTGKVAWTKPKFRFSPSLIAADGLLFVRVFNGLVLLEANPKGYVEKGRVDKLLKQDPVWKSFGGTTLPPAAIDGGWTMPVLSRGRLYVRAAGELICYKISAKP